MNALTTLLLVLISSSLSPALAQGTSMHIPDEFRLALYSRGESEFSNIAAFSSVFNKNRPMKYDYVDHKSTPHLLYLDVVKVTDDEGTRYEATMYIKVSYRVWHDLGPNHSRTATENRTYRILPTTTMTIDENTGEFDIDIPASAQKELRNAQRISGEVTFEHVERSWIGSALGRPSWVVSDRDVELKQRVITEDTVVWQTLE